MTYSLVLGSSSSYRQAQLRQLTENFTAISPDIDETAKPGESAKNLALRLSEMKALATYSKTKAHSSSAEQTASPIIVISSDQTAALDSWVLGKPKTKETAIEQLQRCSGKTVTFHSAVSILNTHSAQQASTSNEETPYKVRTEVTDTRVVFRSLEKSEIERYVDRDEPLHCAGSFKCESLGIALFESISSSDPSALIGLPLISVARILREIGINVIDL